MLIDVDPELMIALVETVASSIETIGTCIDEDSDCRASALRTGERAVAGLQVLTSEWIELLDEQVAAATEESESESKPNTDNPETCGHNPPYFDLPGQTMCRDCGASRIETDAGVSWAIL